MSNIQQAAAMNEGVIVRTLIAEHLGVETKRVSDQARFFKDLGACWLDRLDLIMALEDHFDIELDADDVVDIEIVGDLIRFIETYRLH